jgi:hypothetical protein
MTQEEVTKEVENYNGTNSFMNSLKKGLKKYGSLTDNQTSAAIRVIEGARRHEQAQKRMNITLVGDTIKIGRKIALGIKEEYGLEFHPILIDVTAVTGMTDRALRIKGKLTKENGGICRCCAKTLTDDISKVTGIGPICSKYVGVPHPRNLYDTNEIETYKKNMSEKIDSIGEFEFWIPKKAIVKWNGMGGVMVKM